MVKTSWPRTGFDAETKIPFRYFNEEDIKKYSDELKRTGTNIEEFLKKHDISNKEKTASLYWENYQMGFEKVALWKTIVHNAKQWTESVLRYSPVYRGVKDVIKNPQYFKENARLILGDRSHGYTRDMGGAAVDVVSGIPGVGTAIGNLPEVVKGMRGLVKYRKNVRQAKNVTKSLENIEDPVERAKLYRQQSPEVQKKIKVEQS